jgi:LysM repeat protein/uncharacterized protein YcbK (DUF882 family)
LLGLLLLPATAHAESRATTAQTHVVYSGQRLGSIAKRYGVSVEAICTANDLQPTTALQPGQRLLIPARGDRDGSRARALAGHERSRRRSTSERPAPPPTHRVESGQRLDSIARRYGVSVDDLRACNGIGTKALIVPGQLLKIPGGNQTGESSSARPAGEGNTRSYRRAPERRGHVELFSYSQRFRGQILDKKGRPLKAALPGVSRVLATTGSRPKLDARLLRVLVDVSDAFGGRPLRIVSGFRASSYYEDSRHKSSQAVDFSIPGVPNQVLRDYLRTFKKVGVGYYPNSSFVHLDVREYSAYWVDYAGPGEAPRRNKRHNHGSQENDDVHEEEPADVPEREPQTDSVPGALPVARSPVNEPPSLPQAPKSAAQRGDLVQGATPAF